MELTYIDRVLAVEYAVAILGLFLAYKCLHLKKDNMNFFMKFMIIDKDKAMAIKCTLCTLPSVVGTVLQIVYGGSYLLLGIILTGWSMYIEICLDRQKAYELSDAVRAINDELKHSNKEVVDNMRTILALSDIYYVLYEVDFIEDSIKEIKAPEVVADFVSKFSS